MRASACSRWCLFAFFLAWGPGCSGDGLNRVQGKVLIDGKGAEGAVVIFHPKTDSVSAQKPSAVAAAGGNFSLTTGTKQGAPAGEYVVTVIWPAEPLAQAKRKGFSTSAEEPVRPDRLGGRYADPKTSKIQATIRAGSNQLPPFEVR